MGSPLSSKQYMHPNQKVINYLAHEAHQKKYADKRELF